MSAVCAGCHRARLIGDSICYERNKVVKRLATRNRSDSQRYGECGADLMREHGGHHRVHPKLGERGCRLELSVFRQADR